MKNIKWKEGEEVNQRTSLFKKQIMRKKTLWEGKKERKKSRENEISEWVTDLMNEYRKHKMKKKFLKYKKTRRKKKHGNEMFRFGLIAV